jgi:hypothetical protein
MARSYLTTRGEVKFYGKDERKFENKNFGF